MLCYRDKSFCSSDCVNRTCSRNFTPEQKAGAEKWWGSEDVPVCFKEGCSDYIKPDAVKLDYISDRVFEGTREVSPERAKALREIYKK